MAKNAIKIIAANVYKNCAICQFGPQIQLPSTSKNVEDIYMLLSKRFPYPQKIYLTH
jgi:hypothetical protein